MIVKMSVNMKII